MKYLGEINDERYYQDEEKVFVERTMNIGDMSTAVELREEIDQVLAIDPNAVIDQEQKKWDDGFDTVLSWKEQVPWTSSNVVQLLANNKKSDDARRAAELRQLEELKKKYEG